jgi:hypothetical protein
MLSCKNSTCQSKEAAYPKHLYIFFSKMKDHKTVVDAYASWLHQVQERSVNACLENKNKKG